MQLFEQENVLVEYLRVTGRVQGVGFRPFVHRLATSSGLRGGVSNQSGAVHIQVIGAAAQIEGFKKALVSKAPINARIDSVTLLRTSEQSVACNRSSEAFSIEASSEQLKADPYAGFPIDFALCGECLKDIKDPNNKRYAYAFTSCAECGPRFAITQGLPFDRQRTSMSHFPPCPSCQQEYRNPMDRRFHAQTISCPDCGPNIYLLDSSGKASDSNAPYQALASALLAGEIIAVKSTGGFHLCCDGRNARAIAKLRILKNRLDKPFAVMVPSIETMKPWVEVSEQAKRLFEDPSAPIVLLPKTDQGDKELEHLSKNCRDLGILRPYNGIYHCLFKAATDAAKETSGAELLLAVTSANLSGEPIISETDECISAFKGKVSHFLSHNLEISNPIDDSVIQGGDCPLVFRLARGFAPLMLADLDGQLDSRLDSQLDSQINSHLDCHSDNKTPALALGAHEKSTVAVTDGARVWISPELGKLNSVRSCQRFETMQNQFAHIAGDHLKAFACDLHPDFASSQLAEKLSQTREASLLRVAHHHAHLAAVAMEHVHQGPMLGLTLDGFGLGTDMQAWGGELLLIEGESMQRLGHITQLKLAGGDKASRHPKRCAHSVLSMLNTDLADQHIKALAPEPSWDVLIEHPSCPTTTSMGRWFDAIAAILGFNKVASYEAEAAIHLEYLASRAKHKPSALGIVEIEQRNLNLLPLVDSILAQPDPSLAAWIFHIELADGLSRWLQDAQAHANITTVAASGGCLQNRILRERLAQNLKENGLELLLPKNLPCNDAAISCGQLYVAQHALARKGLTTCV